MTARKRVGAWLLPAYGVAILPNALVAFGVFDFEGGWVAIRVLLSSLFLVVLVVWVVLYWRERRGTGRS